MMTFGLTTVAWKMNDIFCRALCFKQHLVQRVSSWIHVLLVSMLGYLLHPSYLWSSEEQKRYGLGLGGKVPFVAELITMAPELRDCSDAGPCVLLSTGLVLAKLLVA